MSSEGSTKPRWIPIDSTADSTLSSVGRRGRARPSSARTPATRSAAVSPSIATTTVVPLAINRSRPRPIDSGSPGVASSPRTSIRSSLGPAASGGAASRSRSSSAWPRSRYREGCSPASGAPWPHVGASAAASSASSLTRSRLRSPALTGSKTTNRAPGGSSSRTVTGGVIHGSHDSMPGKTSPSARRSQVAAAHGSVLSRRRASICHQTLRTKLPCWVGHQPRGRLDRPLARDGEHADGVDLIAPQLDPDRLIALGGEHVDDPAPHRHFTPGLHPIGSVIARQGEVPDEPLEPHVLAWFRSDRFHRRRADPLRDRARRRHHHRSRLVFAEDVPGAGVRRAMVPTLGETCSKGSVSHAGSRATRSVKSSRSSASSSASRSPGTTASTAPGALAARPPRRMARALGGTTSRPVAPGSLWGRHRSTSEASGAGTSPEMLGAATETADGGRRTADGGRQPNSVHRETGIPAALLSVPSQGGGRPLRQQRVGGVANSQQGSKRGSRTPWSEPLPLPRRVLPPPGGGNR